jgi:hypothetical protein
VLNSFALLVLAVLLPLHCAGWVVMACRDTSEVPRCGVEELVERMRSLTTMIGFLFTSCLLNARAAASNLLRCNIMGIDQQQGQFAAPHAVSDQPMEFCRI